MILFGHLLLCGDDATCHTQLGSIRVQDGVVVDVQPGDRPDHFDAGGSDALICPGFIDAHVHLPQFDVIGAHGLPLLRWLDEVTFPAEMRWADPDFAAAMTRRVLGQLFSVGTTAIAAYATSHHDSAKIALELATRSGMRGVIGQVLMDREGPAELCFDCDRLLDEAAALQELYPADLPMSAAVTPRFAIACSEPLLAGAGHLAGQTGAIVQTHLAETIAECDRVSELFGGRTYVDVYDGTGLLSGRSLLGHGIHLDAADRARLEQTGSVIAHCPTANSFLRSGACDRDVLARDGVKLALGSDIGAGYERSMVRVARAMIETAAWIGDRFPSAATAWHAITAGNADAMGWDDGGRIEVGKSADLVIATPTVAWRDHAVDPLAMLMFAWDDRWIDQVLVQGKPVFSSQ